MTQQGNALSIHFAANKDGLRYIKRAINDFCEWAFIAFDWCDVILGKVNRKSVMRLIIKCGFEQIAIGKNSEVYARSR